MTWDASHLSHPPITTPTHQTSAIILFSGLGSIEVAQESLSVGIGALAGSTIMLLTVPWGLSVFAGRVDIKDGRPNYTKKPKLTADKGLMATLFGTGVAVTDDVRHGGVIMALTLIPYLMIQIPAMFLKGSAGEVAEGEHWWSLAGFVVCLIGLFMYMRLQLRLSAEGQDKDKRIAIAKKTLQQGKMSLKGVLKSTIQDLNTRHRASASGEGEYASLGQTPSGMFVAPPPEIIDVLKEILHEAFHIYDKDGNGKLEKGEIRVFLRDFHENIDEKEISEMQKHMDTDSDEVISFDEFVCLAYHLIMSSDEAVGGTQPYHRPAPRGSMVVADSIFNDDPHAQEEEEMPEEFTDLTPEEQQRAIKLRAFKMLALGTVLVVYFSDPMVDVMQEIANRAHLPAFYVSFVLAPVASNSSEVVASMFYAAKKTRKTMTVSMSALVGAACTNNTFW
jgi:Ca2+/Na+ antiporter